MLVETWEKKRGISKSRFLFLVFNTSNTFDDHVTFREDALNDRLGVATYLVTL